MIHDGRTDHRKYIVPNEVTYLMHMHAWNPYMWYLQEVQGCDEEPEIIRHDKS